MRIEASGNGVKDILVSAVRDASEQIVREDPTKLRDVVAALEERGWRVFQRIVFHLLLVHPDAEGAAGLIRARLTDRVLFDESERRELRREYRRLARDHFRRLRPEDQALVLRWIEAGPDAEAVKERLKSWEGRPPTEEEIRCRVRQWQVDRLAPIAEALPEDWKARYDALVTEFGTPPDADFALASRAYYSGPTSPLSVEELKAKPVEEIVEYLMGWTPPEGFMAPSREGVGRALTEAVAADPRRFFPALRAFRELHPTYVRSLLEGLSKAPGERWPSDWAAIIDLCRWVVEQPREFAGTSGEGARDHDEDPDWGWTRKTIARLLMAGLEAKQQTIPFELREAVWTVLGPLTDDPDPTPEHEAQYGGTPAHAPALAINSVRGDAMHAVVDYALWLRRHFHTGPEGEAGVARGFEEMPKVRAVLDRHLDPAVERSAAVRSAYGRYLPWLIMLDRRWAEANLRRIFPDDPALAHLRDAAWETYILFCEPFNDPLVVLGGEYANAIDRIDPTRDRGSGTADPDEHLAQHLMVFYWRGTLPLDEPDGVLPRFFAKASARLRRNAIEFIGRSLRETKDEVPQEIKDRFTRLWTERMRAARESGEYEELHAFGWWFASAKLDEDWALRELLTVLRLAQRIDPDFLVLERLRELAPRRAEQAIECLRHMVEGAREPWELQAWGEEMKKIIRAALQSANAAAEAAARKLVNMLAARGELGYRELLGP